MKRIDVLGPNSPGLQQLRGAILAETLDPELQAISEETSRELATPTAVVSLILERVQFLRGYHGLLPAMEASRATDRDISFCQFVVRDATLFEVNDAAHDERVPQELVERYGIASYLGAPIILNGQAVGAMCALDSRPRMFSDRDRETLARMAAMASRRLAVLAMLPREHERALHDSAVRPVFSEIRNRLQPLLGNLSMLDLALTELAAAHRLALHVAATGNQAELNNVTGGDKILASLREGISSAASNAEQIHRAVVALERATLVTAAGCPLSEVLEAASILAHHRTKLIAGVRCSGDRRAILRAPRAVAINAVAASFGILADAIYAARGRQGIDVAVVMEGTIAVLQLTTGLENAALTEVAHHLMLLLGDTAEIAVYVSNGLLEIELAVRPAAVLRLDVVVGAADLVTP
jgi:hypothetical protein